MQLKVSTAIPQDPTQFSAPCLFCTSRIRGYNDSFQVLWALHGLYCPLLILLLYPGLCEHCTRSCHQEAIDFFWMLWVLYHPFLDAFCTAWGSITFWMLPVLYRKLAPSSGNIEYCMRRSYGHFLDALGTALGSIALFWVIRVLGFITLFWLLLVLQRQVSPFSVCF